MGCAVSFDVVPSGRLVDWGFWCDGESSGAAS